MTETATGTEGGTLPSGATSVPAGYVPQAELDAAEARRRDFQSQNDRLKAELAAAKNAAPAAPAFDADALAQQFEARMMRSLALREERAKLSQEFSLARPEVFEQSFDSPEAMRAAAEASHRQEEQYRSKIRDEETTKIVASLKERGFDVPAPQTPPAQGTDGAKQLTAQEINALPFSEFAKLDPAVVDRVLSEGA